MYLSDSECFVLGALEAASNNTNVEFFEQLRQVNMLLGLARPPSVVHEFQLIADVPSDTRWARDESISLLTDEEFAELREARVAERRLAEEWIESTAEGDNTWQGGLNALLKSIVAFGYAFSQPANLYGLSLGGDLYLIETVPPLAPGLLRDLTERLSKSTRFPLMWRAAVPSTVADIPAAFEAEDFVPGPDCTDALCGVDAPEERLRAIRSLDAGKTHPDAHGLGASLWATVMAVQQIVENPRDPSGHNEAGQATSAPGVSPEIETRPEIPEVIGTLLALHEAYKRSNAVDGPQTCSGVIAQLNEAKRRVGTASELAVSLGMPNVASLLTQLESELNAYGHNLEIVTSLGGNPVPPVPTGIPQTLAAAFCVAYGDLLLRERYSPTPIPKGEARQRLLRQPDNIRVLITTALGGLRKDAGDRSNFSAELVLLCTVLERLVRDSAELYLDRTQSFTVADLLKELRAKARMLSPEETDLWTITNVATTLHHTFRNPSSHAIETLGASADEAMFVAYGTLVLLAAVERATARIRPR